VKRLLSTDHFSVDGTLIEAWASMKSFRPKSLSSGEDPRNGAGDPPDAGGGRNKEADFHGQKRSNATHASTTDPEARLYRKGPGKEAKLCFIGHALMENRHGLFVDACLTQADGHAERIAAFHMIEPRADRPRAITLGADKAYDAEDFVNELRTMRVTPHVAQNTSGRASAIDGRTTRHEGYAVSQRIRKRIEEGFGWIKTVAGQDKTRFGGCNRLGLHLRGGRLRSGASAEARGGADMSPSAGCMLVGRWRIVEADLWDREYLDLCGPAAGDRLEVPQDRDGARCQGHAMLALHLHLLAGDRPDGGVEIPPTRQSKARRAERRSARAIRAPPAFPARRHRSRWRGAARRNPSAR
jgi:hypothetical protein